MQRYDDRAADVPAAPRFLAGSGEMGELTRIKDWSATGIGPMESWSPALKLIVSFMLASRFPQLLWWGPDYISLYNDAYRSILGSKHPDALGRPFRDVWPEVKKVLMPLIDVPFNGGAASWTDDILLEVNRHGYLEESHFAFDYCAVPDESVPSGIGGVLATVQEITTKVVGERRIRALRDLGVHTGQAKSGREACANMAEVLGHHTMDVPFALLYLLDDSGERALLRGASGVAPGAAAAPESVALDADAAVGWPFGQVLRTQTPELVMRLESRFSEIPPGPWADPPHQAVLIPIKSNIPHKLAGILVAGVSARLALDEQYRSFFDLVAAQIAAAIANARAYEAERERAEALAEIDRAKTAFFSSVSHEFRTPLTLIMGPLEQILQEPQRAPAEQRALVEVARRNGRRLGKLVNTLLEFSRIEAGRVQAVYEPTHLGAFTAELVSNFTSLMDMAGLEFVVDCPPLSQPFHVSREMWETIVLNLVSNAFKFTFGGRVTVRLREAGGCAVLTVEDTGTGIPQAELAHVFERFHRVAGARGRSIEGSGIGLALVSELVKLHGGTIGVESEEGRGSVFTIKIPAGSAHLPADQVRREPVTYATFRVHAYVEEASRWMPAGGEDSPKLGNLADEEAASVHGAAPSANILIADDNADMREYLVRLLGPHHRLEIAGDGEAALALALARPPDLVITDIMMPKLDGIELVKAIREDPSLRDVPVITLSARAGREARVEGTVAGADDYLVKPFSGRELIASVANNLRLAALRRESTAALQSSEARFRALVNATSDVVYRMSADWTEMRRLDGRGFLADTESPTVAWLKDYILPEDEPAVVARIEEAVRTKSTFQLEHRVRRADGTVGWTQSRAIPIVENGEIVEWFGTASDVSPRKLAEERQHLMVNELNHRVKNTLAIVQSLARQSLRTVDGASAARDQLESRLVALAKAHDILTHERWEGAPLDRVVGDAVRAHRLDGRDQIELRGDPVWVSPRQAIALSMALHELATNAAKYGALSSDAGKVRICWERTNGGGEPYLRIAWSEHDGPEVSPPGRGGFGSRLLGKALAQDLGGEVELEFDARGVRCTMHVSLRETPAFSMPCSE
jgi:signal transduction histidine kinase/CheY-like chemotaxis protein